MFYDQFHKYFSAREKGSIAIANLKISKNIQGEMGQGIQGQTK